MQLMSLLVQDPVFGNTLFVVQSYPSEILLFKAGILTLLFFADGSSVFEAAAVNIPVRSLLKPLGRGSMSLDDPLSGM